MGVASAGVSLNGGSFDLNGGSMGSLCDTFNANGNLILGGGQIMASDLSIPAGGVVQADTGTVQLSGNLTVQGGRLDIGTSTVALSNSCATQPVSSSTISGVSAFYQLKMAAVAPAAPVAKTLPTGYSHTVYLPAGQTITVNSQLSMSDVALKSTGSGALLNLVASAGQTISNVGVDGVNGDPAGQWLAASQTNQIVGGVAARWFTQNSTPINPGTPTTPTTPGTPGASNVQPVPGLGGAGVALLAAAMGALGMARRRRHG